MEDWLKCQISPLVKYRQHQSHDINTIWQKRYTEAQLYGIARIINSKVKSMVIANLDQCSTYMWHINVSGDQVTVKKPAIKIMKVSLIHGNNAELYIIILVWRGTIYSLTHIGSCTFKLNNSSKAELQTTNIRFKPSQKAVQCNAQLLLFTFICLWYLWIIVTYELTYCVFITSRVLYSCSLGCFRAYSLSDRDNTIRYVQAAVVCNTFLDRLPFMVIYLFTIYCLVHVTNLLLIQLEPNRTNYSLFNDIPSNCISNTIYIYSICTFQCSGAGLTYVLEGTDLFHVYQS